MVPTEAAVEAAAKAMHEHSRVDPRDVSWEDSTDGHREWVRADARVALSAAYAVDFKIEMSVEEIRTNFGTWRRLVPTSGVYEAGPLGEAMRGPQPASGSTFVPASGRFGEDPVFEGVPLPNTSTPAGVGESAVESPVGASAAASPLPVYEYVVTWDGIRQTAYRYSSAEAAWAFAREWLGANPLHGLVGVQRRIVAGPWEEVTE